jgi:cytochrome oxidase Cu insertion factor (SCO1/SenC/PrrC family)
MSTPHRRRNHKKNGNAPLMAVILAGVVLVGGFVYSLVSSGQRHAPSGSFSSLVDHNGRAFASDTQSSKYKLVVFGYTHCPDVCPTTLLKVHEVLNALGPDSRHVAPLFVTVDPARDTPAVLAQYTAAFDPRILGLTGTTQALRALADAYGVLPADQVMAGHEDMPGHSAMIYLLGPDNAILGMYGPATEARAIASDVLFRTNRMAAVAAMGGVRG